MLLNDFGPFAGMTYLGRQNVDAIVKDTAAASRTALTRLVERQTDILSDETTVVSGNAAYAEEWKIRGFIPVAFGFSALAALAAAIIVICLTRAYTQIAADPTAAPFFIVVALLIFSIASPAFAFSVSVSLRAFRFGYAGTIPLAFRALAADVWIIGEKALYVSSQDVTDKRPVVKTVFYDAIGTVDAEPTKDGLDRLVVRSRDGSHIAEILAPVTSSTDNAFAIVEAISTRLPD